VFQSFKDLNAWFKDPYTYLDHQYQLKGDSFILDLPMMRGTLLTSNPDHIESISKNPSLIGGIGSQFLHHLIGESVITQFGEEHALTRKKLNNEFLLNIDYDKIKHLSVKSTEHYLSQLKSGEIISMSEWANQITLRTIIEFLLGEENNDHKLELYNLVIEWKKSLTNSAYFFIKPMQINFSKNLGWGKFIHLRKELHQLIHNQIINCPKNDSFLAKMIYDYQWNSKKVLEEFISILMFGHDTSAIIIAWWTAHLLENNLWQNSLTDKSIESSLKEATRLTPPVVHLTRVATKDLSIGQYDIQKNQRVFPCIYLSHMNSKVFPDPKKFILNRFEDKNYSSNVYYPFGFGDRICLGKKFAEIQTLEIAKILLAEKKFEFKKSAPKPVRQFFLMVPEHGTLVKVL